jgi:O-acetyl-ADP-ribose deacetylase (regulator of RNase III)
MTIHAVTADITLLQVDAIVNSANPTLLAGGGVCGAIHKAAGPELEKACLEIGKRDVGTAIITPAFNLPSRFVIHAVGPRWLDGQRGEPDLLRSCYESIFAVALENKLTSLAIPSISTGIYHYPLTAAVDVAVEVTERLDNDRLKVIFACFDEITLGAYQLRLERNLGSRD